MTNASKLRVDLRFFAELVAVGLFSEKEAMNLLSSQLILLTKNDMKEHNNLTILVSFCRHCGDDYAGLISTKYRFVVQFINPDYFSPDIRMYKNFVVFSDYWLKSTASQFLEVIS